MFLSSPLWLVRTTALLLLAAAGGLGVRAAGPALRALLRSYAVRLGRDLAYLRLPLDPARLMVAQLALSLAAQLALVFGRYALASGLAVAALAPRPWLTFQRSRRTTQIEAQLDGWLFGLASTLRTTPAPGQALAYSAALVAAPLREELETLRTEQTLGTPLDDALARMGARIGSRTVQSALATLRIGRASGGDMPRILERSAATLREMARLEGVVRTKTAESKAQAWLLAVLPFPLIALLHSLDPRFLAPLVAEPRGLCVLAAALVSWLASLLAARRILDVDL